MRNGRPDMRVDSDLAGWTIDAPAPLRKSATETLPLSIQIANTDADHDSLRIAVGNVANARFERAFNAAGDARVERGAIGVGDTGAGDALPLPEVGIQVVVNLQRFDVDRWRTFFDALDPARPTAATPASAPASGGSFDSLVPTRIAVQVRELVVAGKPLANVVAGASRSGEREPRCALPRPPVSQCCVRHRCVVLRVPPGCSCSGPPPS